MTKDNAKTMGFVILAFNLIILLLAKSDFDPFSPMTIRMLFIISILIRIVSCIWVTIVASEINHTSGLWAVFALLFPAIALIVIGSTNSNYSTMTDENDSNEPLEIKHILVD